MLACMQLLQPGSTAVRANPTCCSWASCSRVLLSAARRSEILGSPSFLKDLVGWQGGLCRGLGRVRADPRAATIATALTSTHARTILPIGAGEAIEIAADMLVKRTANHCSAVAAGAASPSKVACLGA